MKGDPKVIEKLNQLLADELTAINQYMVHSEMCDNWGYEKLHKELEKRALDEMHHAEWLISRTLFLEGIPIVSKLNPINIGSAVPDMMRNGEAAERDAIRAYNEGVLLARGVKDETTADLFTKILSDEEKHIDWFEAQQDQIEQMSLQNYLAQQTEA